MSGLRSTLVALLLATTAACASAGPPPLPPVVGVVRQLDGSSLSLASLRGRPAVLFLFETASDPSLLDFPRLVQVHGKHGARLHVLAVALDRVPAAVTVFAETFAPPFPVVVPQDWAQFVGPQGPMGPISVLPTTALLDAQGLVVGRVDGAWPAGALEQAVDELLAADRPSR